MADYTVVKLEDAPDIFGGQYPGEMRSFTEALGNTQVAFTYRRMPAQSGGKGSYGHSHKTQEEVYFLISGNLQVKVDDEVLEVGPGTVWRVGPSTVRSVWNEGPDDVHLVIVSPRVDDSIADAELHENFCPA